MPARPLLRTLSLLTIGCAALLATPAHAIQIATTTTLTASPATGVAGSPLKFTVTVMAGSTPVPSGQVAICNDVDFGCNLAEAFVVLQLSSNGTASVNLIGVGSDTLVQAGFAGTKTYAPSTSPEGVSFPFVNLNVPTTTSLTATGAPGNYTLTAALAFHSLADGIAQQPSAPVNFIDTSNGNHVIGAGGNVFMTPSLLSTLTSSALPAVGAQPNHVVAGDFNGDGLTDLAIVNTGDNTVSILISKGDGTFKPQVTYATGHAPGAIITGDFNGDGNLDLAILNVTDKTVSVLRGTGTGTFLAQTTYATGTNPIALATGDLDEDGIADLVVLNHNDKTVSILLGNGDATFKSQVTYATGNDPRSIAVGDTNLDGHVDVLVANFADNTLSMLFGAGDGTLVASTPMPTGHGPIAVALVDLDDAGYASLVFLNSTDNTMTILSRQFGSTTYVTTTYSTGVGPLAMIFEDYNEDRTFDPVVLSSDGTLDIYPSSGNFDGIYGPTPFIYSAPIGATSLIFGDFNGDGLADIAVAAGTTTPPALLLQQFTIFDYYQLTGISLPGLSSSHVIASYGGDAGHQASSSTAVTLFDSPIVTVTNLAINPTHGVSPGQTDTLTATFTPTTVGTFNATGSITFMDGATAVCPAVHFTNGTATCTTGPLPIQQHIFKAIYSGDTFFASSSSATRSLNVSNPSITALALSANTAPVGTPVMASVSVQDLHGPVNGGTVNLCESTAPFCTGTALLGTVQLQNANGAAPGTASMQLLLPAGPHNVKAVALGTVPDAMSSSTSHLLTVFPVATTITTLASSGSAGNNTLTATVTSSPDNAAATGTVITYTDATNTFFSKTATLGASAFMNSFATPVGFIADGQSGVVKDIKLASLRSNGVVDMIYPNYSDGELAVRLGQPSGTGTCRGVFGCQVEYALPSDLIFSCPDSVAIADFNGDGKPDVIVGDDCAQEIFIFLGNGDGTFPAVANFSYDIDSTVVIPFTSVGPMSVTTGDFNQDGHPDIAVGTDEGSIYILLNKGTGDGSFNPAVLYTGYQGDNFFSDITAVDLNGDGSLDLIYTQAFGGAVSVMLNNGDGTFQPEIQNDNTGGSGFEGNGFAVGDFNNDGVPDAVVSDGQEVCTMLGNSDGTFQDGTCYSTGSFFAFAVAVGDFNGDGVQDIVVTNGADNGGIGILTGQSTIHNNPDGSITFLPTGIFNNFKKLNNFGGETLYMAAGDINGDGVTDVVVQSQDDDKNYVLIGSAGFTATAKVTGVSIPGSATASAHSIIASYPGDANHTASASAGLGVAGVPITTTTTLAVAPATNSAYGLTTTVTATVTPAIVTSYISVSPVTFKDGATTLSPTKPLSSGSAAYPYVPAIGTHSYTAVYTADANFKTSTSGAMADTVAKATPVFGTMIFSPAQSQQVNSSQIVTISDTLNFNGGTAPTATNVTYVLNGVSYSPISCTLVGTTSETCTANVPAATIAALGLNNYTVTAAFTADTNYNAATGTSGTFTISAAAPATASVSAISSAFGSTAGIIVTATESGSSGAVTGGVVTFGKTGTATGSFSPTTCTLPVGGSCTTTYIPTGTLAVGVYTNDITASFSTIGSYAAANGTSTLTITALAPAVTTVSAASSTFGSTTGITITATESGSGGAVTGGIVTFGTAGGVGGSFSPTTCTLTAAGTCTTTYTPSATLAVATYTNDITASFAAVGNYLAASAANALTINQATQTINFTAPTSPVTYGVSPITLHATSGSSGISILFTIDPSSTATGSISGSTLTVTSAGVFNINANQAGNANFIAAAQVQQSIVVSKADLSVSANGASMPFGGPLPTLTGTLSGVIGSDGITATYSTNATVTSPVGNTYLVTPALVDPNNRLSNYSLQTSSNSTAVFTVTSTPLTVTAANVSRVYGAANPTLVVNVTGQKNSNAFTATASTTATSTSPVLAGGYVISPAVAAVAPASLSNYTVALVSGTLAITQAATAVALVQTAPATAGVGTGVSAAFTATVTDASTGSTGTPTGFVNFFDGATLLNPNPIALTGGVASIANIIFTTVAAHPITAVYLGDNNFSGNTSAVLGEGVVTPSFSISVSPGSLTIARGSSATDTLTFTPVGNYQGSLTLTCNGLPSFASCQFLPSTITFTGNNAVQTSQLTVFTLNAHTAPGDSKQSLLWFPAAGMLAALIAIRRYKLVRMLRPLLMLAITALAITALTGCGSSATFATPIGVNVVTVTATATGASGTSSPNTTQAATISITITQ